MVNLACSWLKIIWQELVNLYMFIRFSVLGFTVILPLLGAATVSTQLTSPQIIGLIFVAITFHNFTYVLNDVIDLPLDRTEPIRAQSPLVQGRIQPWKALAFALFQIPLAFILTALLGGNLFAYEMLSVGLGLMSAYNLWGKRTVFPPFTDVVQGLGWGALVMYGTAFTFGRPTNLTGVVVTFVVVFIVLLNGVHGSLRDLDNDRRYGASTTAILLGARVQDPTDIIIPPLLVIYALTLQALLIGLVLLPLVYNWFNYSPKVWLITTSVVLILTLLSLILLIICVRSKNNYSHLVLAGTWHAVLSLSSLLVLFVPYLEPKLKLFILTMYCLPLLTSVWLYMPIGLWWQSWRAMRKGC